MRAAPRRSLSVGFMAIAIAASTLPAIALAQIYKCVDAGGTTYQQTPCPTSAKGAKVEFFDNGATRESAVDEAAWEAAAREKNVSVGMPRRFVRLALGAPRDTRPGRAIDNAAEVWSYPEPDARTLVIGFRNGNVAWLRHDSPAAEPGPTADDDMAQRMLRRRDIAEGQACDDIAQTLGAPDKSEGAGASDGNSIVRYTWEPGPGDPFARMIVTCTGGRVTGVERVGVR